MFPKPDDLFRQSFAQWEKQTADFWNNLLRDPEFLKTAWHTMEMGLEAQKQFNQMVSQSATNQSQPYPHSPDPLQPQINRLQAILAHLHERVDRLSQELNEGNS
jgi:hypothetical protein